MSTQPAPSATSGAAASAPYLPQNGTVLQRAERAAELLALQQIYQYEAWAGIDLPMATTGAAIASLPWLGSWLRGQAENLLHAAINLELWKALRTLTAKAASSPSASAGAPAALSSALSSSELLTWLRQEVVHREGSCEAIEELARRILATGASGGPSLSPAASAASAASASAAPPFAGTADYAAVYPLYPVAEIVQSWQDDRTFASQRLAGLNPMLVQGVTADGEVGVAWPALRKKLAPAVDDRVVSQFLPGDTLARAVAERRLFVCDYAALGTVTADPDAPGVFAGKRPIAPIALYVRTADFDGLQLAAIQLDQGVADPPVMLACEAQADRAASTWTVAKLFVQAADLSYNQAVNHLGMTHLLEEAFALATYRHLAPSHPLHVLFSFHFAALFVINELGKLTLLKSGPTGLLNTLLETGLGGSAGLINAAYRTWTFADLDFEKALERRGTTAEVLPYFPYRDDGQLVWDVLGRYARDYVQLYYKSGSDVLSDYELQAWSRELRTTGQITSLPELAKVDDVVAVVQRLLWTAGPQHAAVNFPQVEYTTFVPNSPGAPFAPPPPAPLATADLPAERVLATLPPPGNTQSQVQISYTLAGYHYDHLLDYFAQLSPAAAAICRKYHDELAGPEVTGAIEARNRSRASTDGLLPYATLLPRNIPNSTSV